MRETEQKAPQKAPSDASKGAPGADGSGNVQGKAPPGNSFAEQKTALEPGSQPSYEQQRLGQSPQGGVGNGPGGTPPQSTPAAKTDDHTVPKGAEFEMGGDKGDGSVGKSEDGESYVGQVGKGASYTVAQNIWGPIYLAGSIGAKVTAAASIGKETGGSMKVGIGAEIRLGVGVAKMKGSDGFEIGAGGELKGQLEVVPVGIAHDSQTGWKFDAFTGVVSVGINGYVMAQVNGVGPKMTIPARKYDLYTVTGGSYVNGQLTSFDAKPGPGVAQLKADIAALIEAAKKQAGKVADAVDEHAPESVKDGSANVASYLIEGRTEDDRKADEASSAAATNASHQRFMTWARGHRAKLQKLGVVPGKRNAIIDVYTQAWNYANPGDSEVMPNHEAAAGLRAKAQSMEQAEIQAAAEKRKKKEEEAKVVKVATHHSKANEDQVPGAIRGEVKHRVKNHQRSGAIPHGGITYHFRYDAAGDVILVHGGPHSSVVPYRPPWKGHGG